MDLANKKSVRVSPGIGKTTCSYFSPDGKKILFASSHLDPKAKEYYGEEYKLRDEEKKAGKRRTYKWDFDPAMEIFETNPDGSGMKRLTDSPGYDAEASYSPDGKSIVFCSNRSGAENLELYIMDSDGKNVRKLTNAPGCYNGGPLFSAQIARKKTLFKSMSSMLMAKTIAPLLKTSPGFNGALFGTLIASTSYSLLQITRP